MTTISGTADGHESVTTDQASAATGYDADALDWGVARGHFTAPTVRDGAPMWELPRLLAELRAYRRRCRGRQPRASRAVSARVNREHAAERRHRQRLAATVVVEIIDPGLALVRDGLGRELGRVMLGDTLTAHGVWLIQPLARAGHAQEWDLPWARTRDEAVRMLADHDYQL